MFGVDSSELFILAVLALIFIGPKELPSTLRTVGRLVGRVRAHARHFTAGIENVMREAELEEMEKRWREEHERMVAQFPLDPIGLSAAPRPPSAPVMTPLPPPPFATPVTVDPLPSSDEPPPPLGEPDRGKRTLP